MLKQTDEELLHRTKTILGNKDDPKSQDLAIKMKYL
jgi:hypothetical protein